MNGRDTRNARAAWIILTAGLISQTGDWILLTGLLYFAFALTGSALATGVTVAVYVVPALFLGSVAGVFVDRWSKRSTVIATNLLLATGLIPLVAVTTAQLLWVVYAVVLIEAALSQFLVPAQGALLPLVVPPEILPRTNAAFASVRQAARLVGSATGGVILFTAGIGAIAIADALSFVAAAALMLLVPGDRPAGRTPGVDAVEGAWGRLMSEWRDGLGHAWRLASTRALVLFSVITGLGEGIVGGLFAPFFSSVLGGNAAQFGLFLGVQGAGGIAGGLVAVALARRIRAAILVGASAISFGAIDLVLFTYPLLVRELWPAFVLIGLVGIPGAAMLGGYATLQQTMGDDRYRGRLIGTLGATAAATGLVGAVIAGAAADRIGIVPIIAIQGLGYVAAGLIVLLLFATTVGSASRASS